MRTSAGASRAGHAAGVIPASHTDLAQHPRVAALTTVARDGSPQTSVVWCDLDGELVRVNTMRGFAKERNMRRRPRVTLLGYDPRRPLRYLEVRGTVVDLEEDEAREHLDAIASAYAGRPVRYFGDVVSAHYARTEIPVLCRIRPRHVVAVDDEAGSPGLPRSPGGPRRPPTPPAPPTRPAGVGSPVPRSHLDLLRRGICGVFTTMDRHGQPQSSLVWLDADDECARVNTTLERQKGRNLLADPRASLLVVDPDDTSRYVQIRGEVELVRDGALEHLDALTRTYTDKPGFYGHVHPAALASKETRVICRLHARRVTCDAIHAGPGPGPSALPEPGGPGDRGRVEERRDPCAAARGRIECHRSTTPQQTS